MLKNLTSLIAGVLFGLGLAVSQMVNPEKVRAFLDVTGNWDPSLALVMVSAVAVAYVGFGLAAKRDRPFAAAAFQIPTRRDIDTRLVAGAGTFGIGWGVAGYCPGPALAAVALARPEPILFVAAMLLGSWVYGLVLEPRPA